jgi:HK97 family phage major capsid protein
VFAEGDGASAVAKAIADFKAEFETFQTQTKEASGSIRELAEASGAEASAALKAANDAVAKVTQTAENLSEIEQRLMDRITAGGDDVPFETVGEVFTKSKEYKAVLEAAQRGVTPDSSLKLRVEANTITGQSGSPAENDDTLVPTARRSGIVPGAFRTLRVRDLIPTIPTTSNAWQFTRELLFTNAAAETAEGASKPETTLTFEDQTVNIRTIAHFIKASNQILADAPALRAYIDGRLSYGVELREETQIISGNGTGQNISGMTKSGNYTAFTPSSGEQALDGVNRAKYKVIEADYMPTGILLNPTNWGAIERLKGSDNAYLVGNPFGTITPVLWGLPVVASNSMTAGKQLVADFATSYEYAERQSTVIDVGYVNEDFTKNLVTIRAEKRGALATIRPASAYYGDLTL